MGKPIDWKRLAKKAVAEAVLFLPNELAYFYMGEFSLGQLLIKIRFALGNETFPEPTKADLKALFEVSPIPKEVEKILKAEAPDYKEASYHFALQALLADTADSLLEYVDTWAGQDMDRIEQEYTKEFDEKDLENQEGISAGEKALLEQELAAAAERHELYQIYWLKRYLDSGLPGAQIELDRRTAGRIMEVLKPVIEQFAGPAAPSLSGSWN